MKRAILALAVAVGIAAPLAAQTSNQGYGSLDVQSVQRFRDANLRLAKVREMLTRKDFAKAKKEIESILKKGVEHPEAHFLMAKVLYSEKSYAEALASMERAEAAFVGVSSLMSAMRGDRRADLLRRRSEIDATLNRMRGTVPSGGQAGQAAQAILAKIAEAEVIRADIDRELDSLSQPGEQKEPAEYPFFHGNILLRLQKYPEAVTQYEEALAADPAYTDAANNLASLYYSAGQYPKAMEVITRVEGKGATVNPELKKAIADALSKS